VQPGDDLGWARYTLCNGEPILEKRLFQEWGERGYFILNASLQIAISNNYFLTVDIIVTDLSNIT